LSIIAASSSLVRGADFGFSAINESMVSAVDFLATREAAESACELSD
jgi:hypothetical protein